MNIVKTGDIILHELKNGEGMLYEVSEDPLTPFKLVKTLSPSEVTQYKNT